MVYKIVLIRHGESTMNQENRFCGWIDADLSPLGVEEAKLAGDYCKKAGFTEFDIAYTSVLKRAIKTLNGVLDVLELHSLPVHKHWRLNERMYGGLQGLSKSETAAKHGEEQVKVWRRSYDVPPPAIATTDAMWPGSDRKYKMVDKGLLPVHESLKDTVARVLPFWFDTIVPSIKEGKRVLIAAHGNSIRALVKYLENIDEKDIVELNIPTGIPLVFELDDNLKPVKKYYYLADDATVRAAIERVQNQGKAK